jgi:general secretion pathway protein M
MRVLAPRESRMLAILIVAVMVALVWFAIIAPIVGGFLDRAERRRALLATYARDERTLAQVASIGRAAQAQRTRAGLFRFTAADAPAAAAILAERLANEVARTGGEIRGVEDLAAPPGAVHARLQAGMTFAQAVALISHLQNASPLLLVDETDLGAHDAADDPRPGLLDIRIEVSAYFSPTASH